MATNRTSVRLSSIVFCPLCLQYNSLISHLYPKMRTHNLFIAEDLILYMIFAFFMRESSFFFFQCRVYIHSCRNFVKESRKLSSMFYFSLLFFLLIYSFSITLAKGCEITCLLATRESSRLLFRFVSLTLHIEWCTLVVYNKNHTTAAGYSCSRNDHCFTWIVVRSRQLHLKMCIADSTIPLSALQMFK